jgi:coenzyme F420-reducing hydrogenase alpha subunit
VENAFGIVPDEQTAKLRLLLKHMETLQSHVLHLYFFAAPIFWMSAVFSRSSIPP